MDSLDSSDVYRHESGKCHIPPLLFNIIYQLFALNKIFYGKRFLEPELTNFYCFIHYLWNKSRNDSDHKEHCISTVSMEFF